MRSLVRFSLFSFLVASIGLGALACATSKGIRPHDMSVEEHRKAAEEDARKAEHYQVLAESDPSSTEYVSNWNLSENYRRHAAAHRKAAEMLEASDDPEACATDEDAKTYRETCPLMKYAVASVEKTEKGVKVVYKGADAAHLEAHIRCHIAHGKMFEMKHAGVASCPLATEGVRTQVSATEGGAVLLLESDDPEAVKRLQSIYVRTSE